MKEYYIYHIPGVKIGCSSRPNTRVKNQGYTDFEILEKHTNIEDASKREIELQKKYGYNVDSVSYKQSLINSPYKNYSKDKEHQKMAFNKMLRKYPDNQSIAGKKGAMAIRDKYGKFTMEEANQMREDYKNGLSYKELAAKWNCSYNLAYKIIKNLKYKQ